VFFEIHHEPPWSDRPLLAGVINAYLQRPARDNYPNSIDLADELSVSCQAKVAEWITSEESLLPIRHLIAQNYANFRFPVRALLPQVSIVNFHYAYPEAFLGKLWPRKASCLQRNGISRSRRYSLSAPSMEFHAFRRKHFRQPRLFFLTRARRWQRQRAEWTGMRRPSAASGVRDPTNFSAEVRHGRLAARLPGSVTCSGC
jgi:hypothetical protein